MGLDGCAGIYLSGELHKSGHCVVKEALVAFAEITLAVPITIVSCRGPVFHTAAPTDGEAAADEALVAELLLGTGELTFFGGGGEFFYGSFEDAAQLPFWLDEKIAAEGIAGVLDDDVGAALLVEGAD